MAGADITACSLLAADGCCPAGCNTATDLDCAPGCGNGVKDQGETCDPGAPAGCPASCPAVDPANACQKITLANPGTCQAACVNDAIQTACTNGDGCCPSGCNANNDNDCTPKCGNSVVEKGEACDPLTSCPTKCAQVGCQLYDVANAGTCQATCVAGRLQTACVSGDGCCAPGCNANNDNDCKGVCGNSIVEGGETCDGNCPTLCPKTAYSCYERVGDPKTCNVDCKSPVVSCGATSDACCPYIQRSVTHGCDAGADVDCNGKGWTFAQLDPVLLKSGCVDVEVLGIETGGAYDVTTCAPPGATEKGVGDPSITRIVDPDSGVVYTAANDNCSDPTALPNLAKSDCTNVDGKLTMACASPSPGGFISGQTKGRFIVRVCGTETKVPLYVWFNATQKPLQGRVVVVTTIQ